MVIVTDIIFMSFTIDKNIISRSANIVVSRGFFHQNGLSVKSRSAYDRPR